jgi:hypothetical protein
LADDGLTVFAEGQLWHSPLGGLAKRLSTRSVRLARMILIQAIRNAMVNDPVVPNVADLTTVPAEQPGRPSGSFDVEQAPTVPG